MNSPGVLYTTAVLMALVAAACTALCLVWSVPAWRRRLARRGASAVPRDETRDLRGWPARAGSGLISAGIAACSVVGWYGCYCVLAAVNATTR